MRREARREEGSGEGAGGEAKVRDDSHWKVAWLKTAPSGGG